MLLFQNEPKLTERMSRYLESIGCENVPHQSESDDIEKRVYLYRLSPKKSLRIKRNSWHWEISNSGRTGKYRGYSGDLCYVPSAFLKSRLKANDVPLEADLLNFVNKKPFTDTVFVNCSVSEDAQTVDIVFNIDSKEESGKYMSVRMTAEQLLALIEENLETICLQQNSTTK